MGSESFWTPSFSLISRDDLEYFGLSNKEKGDKHEDYTVKLYQYVDHIAKFPTNTPYKDIVGMLGTSRKTIQAKFVTMFETPLPGKPNGSTKVHGIKEEHFRHVDFYVISGAERGFTSLILTDTWIVGMKDLLQSGLLEKSTHGKNDYEIRLKHVKDLAVAYFNLREVRPDLFAPKGVLF
jgi:hypothetical protein